MKVRTKISGDKIYISIFLAVTFFLSIYANVSVASDKPVTTLHDKLVWVEIAPFVQMADVTGNMGTGAHGTFGKFTPNSSTPLHKHTGAYHGVVVTGTMTNPFGDEKNPPKLIPGSYWYVPAGAEHVTACLSDTPCIFYFYADDKFDFIPIEKEVKE